MIGTGLKLAVALYLAYAAVRLWRRAGQPAASTTAVSWSSVFAATLLNPKGLIFAVGIIPFGQPQLPGYLLAFALLIPSAGARWLVAGHLIGAAAGTRRRFVPRIASVALAGFAGLIAASALG